MDDLTSSSYKDFIEYVVKSIVSQPENVTVDLTIDDMGVLLTLKVSKDDMGKVIGKSGQTAKSIRTLLRVIGSKTNTRVNMKIVEPEGSEDSDSVSTETTSSILDDDLEV